MDERSSSFSNVLDFAVANGFLFKISQENYINLPFAVFPSPIPRDHFRKLTYLQPHLNKLIFKISRDKEFLSNALKSVLKTDRFTKKLFEIFVEVQSSESKSVFDFGVLRTDYMFDYFENDINEIEYVPKQIEINTIASGMCALGAELIKSIQVKALEEFKRNDETSLMPCNPAKEEIIRGFEEAWKAYENVNAILVFLVEPNEVNVFDQRALEYGINSKNKQIIVKRKTFKDVSLYGKTDKDGKLYIGNDEVAIVYFRTGYKPENYLSSEHWSARLLIEKSKAIKCPDVALQLAGCKKVQEVLARPGFLENFIEDKDVADSIRATFVEFLHLDMTNEGDVAVKKVLSQPQNYILKPQREGGGFNVYDDDIIKLFHDIGSKEERSAYIAMERIKPKAFKNYIFVRGKLLEKNLVSELGIFGVYFAKNGEFLINCSAGHLLRSKSEEYNEGGLVVGCAVLDSPTLV